VVLFFAGGADTFNMLVPMECSLYEEYRSIRTDLALQTNELLSIDARSSGQTCKKFGVHARLRSVKEMYDKGQAAFVANVGSLVEPTTPKHWRSGRTRWCQGMFSHSHQQWGVQTLKCQSPGVSAFGAGGRIADGLSVGRQKFTVNSFSLSGNAPF